MLIVKKQFFLTTWLVTVTSDQYPYYLNFARRVFSKCLRFSGETLESEKESLKQEFILRGLNPTVLDHIIVICQDKAEQVKAAMGD